jgi:hypothetical protein
MLSDVFFIVMLSDVFFIVMLSVIMLNVVMVSVMAPIQESRKIEITELSDT